MSKIHNEIRKEFYMTFFENKEGYEEKEVHGFWLIKAWNGNTKTWEVSLYSSQSYKNLKHGIFNEARVQKEHLQSIQREWLK